MPGIFGIVDTRGQTDLRDLAERMRRAMNHEAGYVSECTVQNGVALGVVDLGTGRSRDQPLFQSDGTYFGVLHGHIYNADEKRRQLEARGYRLHSYNDAEVALRWLRVEGKFGIAELNGSYTLALWDGHTHKLTVGTDRFGFQPLYYVRSGDLFAFASEVKALLVLPFVHKELDRQAIARYFLYGFMPGDQTFFKSIKRLPGALWMEFHRGHWSSHRYWSAAYRYDDGKSMDAYVDEFIELMDQAVARQSRGFYRVGSLLSGGLDSRTMVAFLNRQDNLQHLFTLVDRNSSDSRYAHQVSKRINAAHHAVLANPKNFVREVEEAVWRTEGSVSVFHLPIMAMRSELGSHVDVVFDGITMMGGFYSHGETYLPKWIRPDRESLFLRIYDLPFEGDLAANMVRLGRLWNKDTLDEDLGFATGKHWLSERLAENGRFPDVWDELHCLGLVQRKHRFCSMGPQLLSQWVNVSMPYFDYDVMDFTLSLPPRFRNSGKIIARKVLARLWPELAEIPLSPDQLPARMHGFQRDFRRGVNRVWDHFRSFLKRQPPSHSGTIRFDLWLRKSPELQSFVHNTLMQERRVLLDYFDMEQIARLTRMHFAGQANHTEIIGRIMTFALWHRQFVQEFDGLSGVTPRGGAQCRSNVCHASNVDKPVTSCLESLES